MCKVTLTIALGVVLAGLSASAYAQEGCKTVSTSCTQMYQTCEKQCQASNNASRCVGGNCEPRLGECKSTGIWKSSQTRAACWKTSNRS